MLKKTQDKVFFPLSVARETNSMVEEFMLLANISVAQKIYDEFSECALLRKHPAPPPSNYDILTKAGKSKVSAFTVTSDLSNRPLEDNSFAFP